MGKPLSDIMLQIYTLCKDLELDDNEVIDVINEVIKYYDSHRKGLETMGVPISKNQIDVD